MLRQLRCSGVLETIRIRRGGFPNRRKHEDYLDRYGVLAPGLDRKGSTEEQIASLCLSLGIAEEDFRVTLFEVLV